MVGFACEFGSHVLPKISARTAQKENKPYILNMQTYTLSKYIKDSDCEYDYF